MSRYLLVILLIGILSIISLTLSIISLTKCKDNFGDILKPDDCVGLPKEEYASCVKNMEILSSDINSQYQGQPANRGITYPGGPEGGSFGNPNILKPEGPDSIEDSDNYYEY
jgi:hypothetical protein